MSSLSHACCLLQYHNVSHNENALEERSKEAVSLPSRCSSMSVTFRRALSPLGLDGLAYKGLSIHSWKYLPFVVVEASRPPCNLRRRKKWMRKKGICGDKPSPFLIAYIQSGSIDNVEYSMLQSPSPFPGTSRIFCRI